MTRRKLLRGRDEEELCESLPLVLCYYEKQMDVDLFPVEIHVILMLLKGRRWTPGITVAEVGGGRNVLCWEDVVLGRLGDEEAAVWRLGSSARGN